MSFFEDNKSKKSEDTNYNVNYNGKFDFVFFGVHEDTIYDPKNVNFWWPKWCLQKRSSKRSSKKDHLLGVPKESTKAQATLITTCRAAMCANNTTRARVGRSLVPRNVSQPPQDFRQPFPKWRAKHKKCARRQHVCSAYVYRKKHEMSPNFVTRVSRVAEGVGDPRSR